VETLVRRFCQRFTGDLEDRKENLMKKAKGYCKQTDVALSFRLADSETALRDASPVALLRGQQKTND